MCEDIKLIINKRNKANIASFSVYNEHKLFLFVNLLNIIYFIMNIIIVSLFYSNEIIFNVFIIIPQTTNHFAYYLFSYSRIHSYVIALFVL